MGSKAEYEARKAAKRAQRAAYQAAGLAKLTPLIIMAKTEHPIGDMLLSAIFPEHQDSHGIGFCVTVEPGRIIAQRDPETGDADSMARPSRASRWTAGWRLGAPPGRRRVPPRHLLPEQWEAWLCGWDEQREDADD